MHVTKKKPTKSVNIWGNTIQYFMEKEQAKNNPREKNKNEMQIEIKMTSKWRF